MRAVCTGLCVLLLAASTAVTAQSLRQLAEWKEMEYEFPDDGERQRVLDAQEYVPGNGVAIDMDIDYGSNTRVFVTVPRFVGGVPITLGTLTTNKNAGGPQIRGYPTYSWNSNQGNNCNGLTSVFRVAIDDCRRLWVLDSGKIGDTQSCQPQLVVFDLDTDQVVKQYKFPASQYKIGSSLFITPVVDVRDPTPGTAQTCPNTMVYIADVNGFGLIVYDLQQDRSWRTQNRWMYPTPRTGTFTIAGESFDLMDGLFALALSPKGQPTWRTQPQRPHNNNNNHKLPPQQQPPQQQRFPPYGYGSSATQSTQGSISGIGRNPRGYYASDAYHNPACDFPPNPPPINTAERLLYFHTLASTTEHSVPLRILDNATMWDANVEASPRSFVEIGNRGAQSSAQAMDSNGNLFFGLVNPIGVGCWDSQRSYGRDAIRVVAQNDETLQFSSGLKVKRNRNGKEELWVLSCRFQKVMTGTMSRDEVNFRIQAVDIEQLLGGQTRCSAAGQPTSSVTFPKW